MVAMSRIPQNLAQKLLIVEKFVVEVGLEVYCKKE